jgi:TonB family protein
MYGEHIPAVPGKPFSCKVVLEMANQLADGTLITQATYNMDARDSQGRTRNEARNWIDPTNNEEPKLTRIELYDPATRTRTDLLPLTRLARQWVLAASSANSSTTVAKPETTRKSLGGDVMEGLAVLGSRVTQVYAVGTLGNDRPLTVVTESWFSEDLKIALLTKRTDPRYGVQTVRATELSRQEPDASLFTIPDDYRVTHENSPASAGARREAGAKWSSPPKCISCPAPPFTEEARAAKFNGTILLDVTIAADGRVENVRVRKGAGMGLDENAMQTVKTWSFAPALREDHQPVAAVVTIEVNFRTK